MIFLHGRIPLIIHQTNTLTNIDRNPIVVQVKYNRVYLLGLKTVCDKLVGSGWFDLIPFKIDDFNTFFIRFMIYDHFCLLQIIC